MTSSGRPWRQPELCSQLRTGNRMCTALASSSSRARADGRGCGPGGGVLGGVPGGGVLGAATGSTRSTGPCNEPSVSSSGWVMVTRGTGCPFRKVGAEPMFSKTHWPASQLSSACCRDTDKSSDTTSFSSARPIRTSCPCWKTKDCAPSDRRSSPAPGALPAAGFQNSQPGGAGGHDGSGCQPAGGCQSPGGAGQPGGGLKTHFVSPGAACCGEPGNAIARPPLVHDPRKTP